MAWKKVTLDDNGGSGGSGVLYLNYDLEQLSYYPPSYIYRYNYWATAQSTSEAFRVTRCNIPTKEGFEFNGYSGYILIRANGSLPRDTYYDNLPNDTVVARWVEGYTISLDKDGGTGGESAIYYKIGGGLYLDSAYTIPATSITPPTKGQKEFLGYFSQDLQTKYVNPDGSFTQALTSLVLRNNLTLYGVWVKFGDLTDHFGLETADGPLMLVASTDGATRSVTETSHSGALEIKTADSSVGAFELGGILLNPTCTYRIRKNGTVQIQLGKAWAKTGTVKSGYMIVSAEYATASDGEPILVIRGVANEGADAINRWNVNLSVNPDHIAQDPMGAVSGGGEMTECKTLITCDPVVPMENGMPCASDVVHGKVVVTATTNAYFGETAPTAAGAFIETNGTPNSETDVDFTIYAFKAERSL